MQQHTPPTPGQAKKEPVLIPLTVGLLGPDGNEMPLKLQVTCGPWPRTDHSICRLQCQFVHACAHTQPLAYSHLHMQHGALMRRA